MSELFETFCSFANLYDAYRKARKGKRGKSNKLEMAIKAISLIYQPISSTLYPPLQILLFKRSLLLQQRTRIVHFFPDVP